MIKKIKKNKFKFLSFLFITTPFVQFSQTNLTELSFYYQDILKLFFITILPFFLFIIICNNKKIILYSATFFFFLFQFKTLNLYFNEILSLFLLLLFFIFTIFFLKKKIFENYLIIFLVINLILTSFFYFYNLSGANKIFNNYANVKEQKIPNKHNIYFIIVDDMMSIRDFEKIYNTSLEKDYQQLGDLGAKYVEGTFLNSSGTIENILNILMLRELDLNKKEFKYRHLNLNYLFKYSEKSPLLKFLKENQYKFKFVGSSFVDCYFFNKDICLNKSKNNFINFYVVDTFLKSSPFILIRKFIKNLLKEKKTNEYLKTRYLNLYYQNDAIKKLLEYKSKNTSKEKTFYLLHHNSPHDPHLYNQDCSFRDKILDPEWNMKNDFNEGYKVSYICAIKKINLFLKTINNNDPEAIIIIQGDLVNRNKINQDDFDPPPSQFFQEFYNKFEKVDVFSLVKSKNSCINKNLSQRSNINVLINFLECNWYQNENK